jgi:glucokinase
MGGAIVRGRTGHASVLAGHLTIDTNGPLCRCGNIGCAEAIASTWALTGLIAALPRRGRLHAMPSPDLKDLFDLARTGDEDACSIREICLTAWATVALNLVTSYDASYVLVTGGAAAAPEVVPFIQEYLRRHVWCLGAPPVVVRGALGSDAALLAATPLWEDRHDHL